MSKIDPNLIEKSISVGHLELLVKDVAELSRCRDAEDKLRQAYNTEKTELLNQTKALAFEVRRRVRELMESTFSGCEMNVAIIVGGQLFVRVYGDNDQEAIVETPHVNFDEAIDERA